ncbi:MAG: hypothetical protein FJW23_09780 [Acidimicrobiia bacterium]|nr:hypothetical protein [Acidimicrobiia bacterium]
MKSSVTRPVRVPVALLGLLALLPAPGPASAQSLSLLEAARRHDRAAVTALLAGQVDVNAAGPDGTTALHWAAYHDDQILVDRLLRAGAVADAANDYGATPLSLACTNGSAPVVEALLRGGATPSLALPSGQTPLMTAARSGSVEAVKALLASGAVVDAREALKGQTALMWAVAEGHVAVVRALIEQGADVTATSNSGFTPLLFAARRGSLELVRLLLDSGAHIQEAGQDGLSVLHIATVRGHSSLAQYLLDRGADPNAAAAGYTPLHWAAGRWETSMNDYQLAEGWAVLMGVTEDKQGLIKALLAQGADPNARITKAPTLFGTGLTGQSLRVLGATPFLLAARSADVDVMRLLAAHGADPTLGTVDQVTPLLAAAGTGRSDESHITGAMSVEAARLALELGADIDAVDVSGETAVHAATYNDAAEIVAFLAARGADLSVKNRRGETPLKIAEGVIRNAMFTLRPKSAEVLKQHGASSQ